MINTARAALVDEAAMLAAFERDQMRVYATDMFAVEPPALSPLLMHPRVITTLHTGALAAKNVCRATLAAVESLRRVLRMEPLA